MGRYRAAVFHLTKISGPEPGRCALCLEPGQRSSRGIGPLLRGGKVLAAGRLAGAFRSIGRADCTNEILLSTRKAGHDVREIRS
jgi:hypothetical protein